MVGLYIVNITSQNGNWCPGPCTKSILDPCSLAETLKLLGLDGPLCPQSGVETEHAEKEHDQALTTFVDEQPGFEQKIPMTVDSLRDFARVSEAEIAQFFSRPVKIFEHDWM